MSTMTTPNKAPSWHWSNQPNAEETKSKLVKNLRHDIWTGKKRPKEVIDKLNAGKDKWIKENPEAYKESRRKAGEKTSGAANARWNGGRAKTIQGYIMVAAKDHPNADRHGYVREHRLIMEKHIGRFLDKGEVVDHINGIKDDNRIENLKLYPSHSEHIKDEWAKKRDVFKTRKPAITIQCNVCGVEFNIKPYQVGKSKYCSKDCLNKSKVGKPSWNAGKKLDREKYPNMGNFKK